MDSKPSLRYCIDLFCLQCKSHDPWAVGNCDRVECSLHPVRPNQALLGKQPTDYVESEVKQEVLDALHFKGLKEFRYVR